MGVSPSASSAFFIAIHPRKSKSAFNQCLVLDLGSMMPAPRRSTGSGGYLRTCRWVKRKERQGKNRVKMMDVWHISPPVSATRTPFSATPCPPDQRAGTPRSAHRAHHLGTARTAQKRLKTSLYRGQNRKIGILRQNTENHRKTGQKPSCERNKINIWLRSRLFSSPAPPRIIASEGNTHFYRSGLLRVLIGPFHSIADILLQGKNSS